MLTQHPQMLKVHPDRQEMTMKTYSSKSNAARAFRAIPDLDALHRSYSVAELVALGHVSEVDGGWTFTVPADTPVVKRHIYKGVQFRRRSVEPEGVTSAVHGMFDEYQAEAEESGKELTRKQYIAKAVKDGVAYYTARTQYQRWSKGL